MFAEIFYSKRHQKADFELYNSTFRFPLSIKLSGICRSLCRKEYCYYSSLRSRGISNVRVHPVLPPHPYNTYETYRTEVYRCRQHSEPHSANIRCLYPKKPLLPLSVYCTHLHCPSKEMSQVWNSTARRRICCKSLHDRHYTLNIFYISY